MNKGHLQEENEGGHENSLGGEGFHFLAHGLALILSDITRQNIVKHLYQEQRAWLINNNNILMF